MSGRSISDSGAADDARWLPRLAASPLTPLRPGGIATVVVWGEQAGSFMRRLFPGIEAGRLVYRRLAERDRIVDETLAVLVPPEEAASGAEEGEICFHGGYAARDAVLDFLGRCGAAITAPEGYLQKARRFDAIRKEAIASLVNAATRRQVAFLLRQVNGELSSVCEAIEAAGSEADRLARLQALLMQAQCGLRLVSGARVLVVGPPNAGKSTLVNRLSGCSRSIVTDRPGTTRDILEARTELEGFPVTLLDSGGLTASGTPLERLGSDRAHAAVRDADMVLCLGVGPDMLAVRPKASLCLGPKADLGGSFGPGVLPVSGLTGLGVDALKVAIVTALRSGGDPQHPAPFTERQVAALREARSAFARGDPEAGLISLRRLRG